MSICPRSICPWGIGVFPSPPSGVRRKRHWPRETPRPEANPARANPKRAASRKDAKDAKKGHILSRNRPYRTTSSRGGDFGALWAHILSLSLSDLFVLARGRISDQTWHPRRSLPYAFRIAPHRPAERSPQCAIVLSCKQRTASRPPSGTYVPPAWDSAEDGMAPEMYSGKRLRISCRRSFSTSWAVAQPNSRCDRSDACP